VPERSSLESSLLQTFFGRASYFAVAKSKLRFDNSFDLLRSFSTQDNLSSNLIGSESGSRDLENQAAHRRNQAHAIHFRQQFLQYPENCNPERPPFSGMARERACCQISLRVAPRGFS
jgi:hypothetical protein